MILKVLGVEVGSKNRGSKNEVKMGRHIGIDFSWILIDFGGQVGAKLGSKIDKKSTQNSIEKHMARRRRLGSGLARFGPKISPRGVGMPRARNGRARFLGPPK